MKAQNLILGMLLMGIVIVYVFGAYYNDLGTAYGREFDNNLDQYTVGNDTLGMLEEMREAIPRGEVEATDLLTTMATGAAVVLNIILRTPTIIGNFLGVIEQNYNVPVWFTSFILLGLTAFLIFLLISAILKWRMQSD